MYSPTPASSPTALGVKLALLFAPAGVLFLGALRYDASAFLLAGVGIVGAGGMLIVRRPQVWKPPTSGLLIALYLIALGWLWVATRETPDGFARLARGACVLVAVGLLIGHDLSRSGLEPRRRSRRYCKTLVCRTRWPLTLAEFYNLPEVQGLREVVHEDAGPTLRLLTDPRPEVRAAGLLALQGRSQWRPGETGLVLVAARQASEPALRCAAINALASATDPDTVASLAEFMRDPALEVRQSAAAVVALAGDNWPVVREQVRAALAVPDHVDDGPLPIPGGGLSAMAVCDLTTWASDAEPLSTRAIRTLTDHYALALQLGHQPDLPYLIGAMVTDPQNPPALRVELVGLLHEFHLVTPDLLDRMTNIDQPGPIRLLAAEILLATEPDHPDGLDVLRGLGRQPNRETALMIARILQARLGMDMGLPADKMHVPPQSKIAAEAARRVFQWASGRAGEPGGPGRSGGRPLSTPSLSGLERTPGPRPVPPTGRGGLQPPTRGPGSLWSPR